MNPIDKLTVWSPYDPHINGGTAYELAKSAQELLCDQAAAAAAAAANKSGRVVIRAVEILSVGWDKLTAYAQENGVPQDGVWAINRYGPSPSSACY